MGQVVHYWLEGQEYQRTLPDAAESVLPGVPWGEHWTLFSPAYWLSQYWMCGLEDAVHSPYKARGSLAEEITFCLLGGFGITAELSTAAFEACCNAGLVNRLETSAEIWQRQLQEPLQLNGRLHRYRYPNQKARYLAKAMEFLQANSLDQCRGKALRDELLRIDGVGYKTAGWVARNFLDADDVAILDIHLIRAGQLCNLFSVQERVERDYESMEEKFVVFCNALNVRPAVLDCLIWDQMRSFGKVALEALDRKFGANPVPSKHRSKTTQLQLQLSI